MQRLEVSGAVRPLWWSLGFKGLTNSTGGLLSKQQPWFITVNLQHSPASLCRPQIQSITLVVGQVLREHGVVPAPRPQGNDTSFPPVVKLTLFHRSVSNFRPPAPEQTLRLLKTFLGTWRRDVVLKIWQVIFDLKKRNFLQLMSFRILIFESLAPIMIAWFLIWRSRTPQFARARARVCVRLFYDKHGPCVFITLSAHQTPN